MDAFIFDQFDLLYRQYVTDRTLIPAGRLVEVAFADLDADPLGTLRSIYDGLALGGFEAAAPLQQRYCASLELEGFKKNALAPLSPQLRRAVAERWAAYSAEFGYSSQERSVVDKSL